MAIHLAPTRDPRALLVEPGNVLHFAGDMCATFAADVTLAAANAELAANGQWLPLDGDPDTSLGDLLLQDSTGPLRLGYGAWRDLLLGMQFHNGRGELVTAGGMTVKNVAGYDLTKFMVGSGGCFGAPATLTTRTHRLPDGALLANVQRGDAAFVHELIQTDLRPQWVLVNADGLTLGYIGRKRQLDFWEAALRRGVDGREFDRIRGVRLERESELRRELWPSPPVGNVRIALPAARAAEALAMSTDVQAWAVDPVHGIAIADAIDPQALADSLHEAGGRSTVYDGGKPVRWDVSLDTARLLKRLKDAFDPDGTLPALPVG